jgi:SIR2-like domain
VIDEDLVRAVHDRTAILFVGSGVSRNLGLPDFGELVDLIAGELGYDADIFRRFATAPELAEFYLVEQRPLGKLRSELDVLWHGPEIDIGESLVHRLIVELDFPLIYTTNYDRWIERAYAHWNKPYVRVASVSDVKGISPGVTQIVKLHGDFDDDDSLVLTESSYFDRLDLESPLDIKLRADALGRSMLFVGYSLSDINIRLFLYKLCKLWRASDYPTGRPRSFIVTDRPNPIQEAIMRDRGVMQISIDAASPGEGLTSFLSELLLSAFHRTVEAPPVKGPEGPPGSPQAEGNAGSHSSRT